MTKMTRRHFVGRSVESAAAAALGAAVMAVPRQLAAGSPNNKVVLGLMGAGGRGMDLIKKMAEIPDVAIKYVCDVEEARGTAAAATLEKIQGSRPEHVAEIRKVLDDKEVHGVVVATPEHWHALATVWACQAGKDVYVEKNISLYVWEGRKMVEAAKKYGRIVQAGFQNRSAPYGFSAREYIKKGGLGTVLYVKVFNMLSGVVGGAPWGTQPDSAPPAGLDWDRWLGPAAERPYNPGVHRGWYGGWDFSGGNASDGIHQLDLARMVLGDPPHPKTVSCDGGRFQFQDRGQMPDVQIVTFAFDKFVMSFEDTGFTPYNSKSPPEVRLGSQWPFWPQNCDRIEIFGTKRMMYLGRHGAGWQVFEGGGKLVEQDKGYHPDKWHLPNFIDCIRSRQRPNGEIEQGHLSACLEHLANIAYRTGNQKLSFDAQTERFVNNDEANKYLRPAYRKHYRVPDEV
jgi:predicted dehydrogenase